MSLFKNRPVWLLVWGLLALTSACSLLRRGENLALGSDIQLEGEASLTCSQECADRGQCGESEQGQMVLLSSQRPATLQHDMALRSSTAVIIDHQEIRMAIQAGRNAEVPVTFYLVNIPERGLGWVPGWCIGK
jgi:hypothetical protein